MTGAAIKVCFRCGFQDRIRREDRVEGQEGTKIKVGQVGGDGVQLGVLAAVQLGTNLGCSSVVEAGRADDGLGRQ